MVFLNVLVRVVIEHDGACASFAAMAGVSKGVFRGMTCMRRVCFSWMVLIDADIKGFSIAVATS